MKRFSTTLLNVKDKRSIALYTQKFIKNNFENPISDMTTVLQNNITFFNDQTMGETILKQSLIKGTFPRLSYNRGVIKNGMKSLISDKIEVEAPNHKADFRLIGEILTADLLGKTSTAIHKITMNYEDPKKIKVITNLGNVNKDVTLNLRINNNNFSLEQDIKAGNNADNPFSGIIAPVPYTETLENYYVMNTKPISLPQLQCKRIERLETLRVGDNLIGETLRHIEFINNLPIDFIKKNILIQEEIFKSISLGAKIVSPSFYVVFIVPNSNPLNEKYFEKLHSSITANIFDNKHTFNNYMRHAFITHNESISEIAQNIKRNKNLLKESGLDQIADDIFN